MAKKTTSKTAKKAATSSSASSKSPKLFIDDPMSGVKPAAFATPPAPPTGFRFNVRDAVTIPASLKAGTKPSATAHVQFAVLRGLQFWTSISPTLTGWQRNSPLDVFVDAGSDLNAYYDRDTLSFFHFDFDTPKRTIFSGESVDVVTHELGHAILDALRPDLWDVMSAEAAAFHESFGDISALLVGLQDAPTRRLLINLPGSGIYTTSRFSRLAESLGWGLRQLRPDSAPPDCLRNAVNAYFYRQPMTLPPAGPDSSLTSEPHSFSRVFTGGAFEAISLMLLTHTNPKEDDLLQTSQDFAKILVDALAIARNKPDFYSQVAGSMVSVATTAGQAAYAEAIRTAFVRRGILSLSSAADLHSPAAPAVRAIMSQPRRAGVRAAEAAPRQQRMAGDMLGLPHDVVVDAPENDAAAQPTHMLRAASLSGGQATPPASSEAATQFATQLMRRGRIDTSNTTARAVYHPSTRKTHEIITENNAPKIVRRIFDCGFDACWS